MPSMRWYYAAFQKILLFPLTLFLLYFSIVHCIMMIRYGRKWMRYEKAWDEMERFQERILSKIRIRKQKPMKTVTIYTDGACSGNPGPGGWGAVLEYRGTEKEISGFEDSRSNEDSFCS